MLDAKQKKNSLFAAYAKAAQTLRAAQSNEICKRTGAIIENGNLSITFLDKCYKICMPEVRFITPNAPKIVEVLILHYLIPREERPINGDFITFKGIPGGMFYFQSFQQRVLNKLIQKFKDNPEDLIKAGKAIGGEKWGIGDCSVVIPVFPQIEMVVQLFQGDDEFPPGANILYSDNIVNFLPAEDSAFLGGYLVGALSGKII